MSMQIAVTVHQIGPTASQGTAREHSVIMDRPNAKGGQNRGAMGGEYLLMSLGGCFMSNLLAAIASRQAQVANITLHIAGSLESAPPHFSAIAMLIRAEYDDSAQMQKLITIAERGCIVANTLKNAVKLTIELQAQ
jgi:putative redox protein